MEFQQLIYFQTVARLQHITKAAEELHITQPSLSNSIHRLEQELGIPLFDRVGRAIQLNQYGKLFLEGVNSALSALESSKKRMNILLREEQEKVRILATTSIQVYPNLIQPLIERCPNISFVTQQLSSDELIDALKTRQLDICLIGDINKPRTIDSEIDMAVLESNPMYIITSRKHHLADHPDVRFSDLVNEPFASGQPQIKPLADVCASFGFSPRILYEGTHIRDVLQAVSSGRYIMLSSWDACVTSGADVSEFVNIPISDKSLNLLRMLYWRKNESSVAVLLLRDTILDFFASGK